MAEKGACVIVGRCADAILPDAVNIFVFADMESRIKRIMSLNPGLSRDEAVNSIEIVDRRRKAYHEYYSPIEWGKMDRRGRLSGCGPGLHKTCKVAHNNAEHDKAVNDKYILKP